VPISSVILANSILFRKTGFAAYSIFTSISEYSTVVGAFKLVNAKGGGGGKKISKILRLQETRTRCGDGQVFFVVLIMLWILCACSICVHKCGEMIFPESCMTCLQLPVYLVFLPFFFFFFGHLRIFFHVMEEF